MRGGAAAKAWERQLDGLKVGRVERSQGGKVSMRERAGDGWQL